MQTKALVLETISNARQLGGYPAADGKRIRDGSLLRSGTLSGASQRDIDKLVNEYALSTVIDLRTPKEAVQNPYPSIAGAAYYHIPVMTDDQDAQSQSAIVDIHRIHGDNPGRAYVEMIRAGALSEDMYTRFFDSEIALKAWRSLFDVLLSHEKGAVLWHCTGGKDRAGLASAIVLSILGVDEDTILADFALSNEILSPSIAHIAAQAANYTSDPHELERVAALAGVYVPHMQRVFNRARAECGSLQAFIQRKVGICDEEVIILRKKYLE